MKSFVYIVLLAVAVLAAPAPKEGPRDKRSFLSTGWDTSLTTGWQAPSLSYSDLSYSPVIEHVPTIVNEPVVVKKIVSVPKVVVKKVVSYAPSISHGWW